ncbi:hypothetical protein BD769DRAFT_1384029 [Suillus cothurnatus]|nr:hypothetical protein BD769DRAFT_1384029 [Suillus cothurnatus]
MFYASAREPYMKRLLLGLESSGLSPDTGYSNWAPSCGWAAIMQHTKPNPIVITIALYGDLKLRIEPDLFISRIGMEVPADGPQKHDRERCRGRVLHIALCTLLYAASMNVPRRGRAQTPFYPLPETRPRPSTSGFQVVSAHAHDVIEIFSDDEVASHASVDVHPEPTPTVAAEDIVEILSDDETAQQADNVMPAYNTSSSDALAVATAELERLRAAIQKISTLPLPLAVISVVRKRFGRIPFSCPTCRDFVGSHEPCKVVALSQLSNALTSLLGDVQGEEDSPTDWTALFWHWQNESECYQLGVKFEKIIDGSLQSQDV